MKRIHKNKQSQKVIIGVTASDAHAVANRLLAYKLKELGYSVINLGPCTTVEEFAQAAQANPSALAILIGSYNGHAYEDLRDLVLAKKQRRIICPVILGGNLSVGSQKEASDYTVLFDIGVDYILSSLDEAINKLAELNMAGMVA